MAGTGFVDDFTEIRVADYVTDRQHLLGQPAIWADGSAAVLANLPTDDALVLVRDRWAGLDAPQIKTRHTQSASGDGEILTSSKLDGRRLSLPFFDRTDNRTPLDTLRTAVFGAGLVLVGFRRETLADSRYILSCSFYGGLNRSDRGKRYVSPTALTLKSQWPYAVVPRTETSGTAFTTAGSPPIIWGVEFTAITANTISVSVGGDTLSVTWAASTRPNRCLIVPSPPYIQQTAYTSAVATSSVRPTGLSGSIRPYLDTATSYTITAACLLYTSPSPRD